MVFDRFDADDDEAIKSEIVSWRFFTDIRPFNWEKQEGLKFSKKKGWIKQ
jgi:hypothetical protein